MDTEVDGRSPGTREWICKTIKKNARTDNDNINNNNNNNNNK